MEDYIPQVIKVYRYNEIISPILNTKTQSNVNASIINTSDVNRIFGWAIYKERKLVIKHIKNASMNVHHDIKLALLENMIVYMKDICMDLNYIKIYVPCDDLIRNKGKLTYICPKYIFHFAQILTIITKATKVDADDATFEKPDKGKLNFFCLKQLFQITIIMFRS